MIQNGKVVNMSYVLKNAAGEELDRADAEEAFSYLHGGQQIVPGLESALEGLKVGDKRNVKVPAKDAYGEVIEQLMITVNRSLFPTDRALETGLQFTADIGGGQTHVFRVETIDGDQVQINGNHPLAGETLIFDIVVLGIRDASQEEIEHGHAHGPHGHHDH